MKNGLSDTAIWKDNIASLKAFYKERGDYFVPLQWKKGKLFSLWVENIRKYPGRLSEEQLRELKKIGFSFNVPKDWNRMFERLEQFFDTQGHSFVPPSSKEFEDLFDWSVSQRKAKHLLTPTQIMKLDGVEFEWGSLDDNNLRWEYRYRELLDFKRKNGHTQVPEGFSKNKSLARWVTAQRRRYKEKALSILKVRRLEEIGFLFSVRDQLWAKRYADLVTYTKVHGHLNRLQIKRDNYTLGLWVETQIVRKDKMSVYRKKKLKDLGLKLEKEDIHQERWNNMYEKLKSYYNENGHCRVPARYNYQLAVWLARNRAFKHKLDEKKIKKLEQLGFKWRHETFTGLWQSQYEQLKVFKKEYGHINVPKTNELYEWLQSQKRMKMEKRLNTHREEKLSRLGVVWRGQWEKKKMEAWESMFKKFKTLKETYKDKYHLKLKDLPELHYWVSRQTHNKTKLSAYKKEKLDSIGFPWDRSGRYNDELWDRKYQELLTFKKKYGHTDVSVSFSNKSLYRWTVTQRTKKIADYKKQKLNKIGFSWANEIKEKKWWQNLAEFSALKKKRKLGELHSHHPLASWIYQQKKNFDRIPERRKKELLKAGLVAPTQVK